MTSSEKDPVKKIDLETALQYGMSEGYPPLVSFIRQFSKQVLHPAVPHSDGVEVVMTCGSTDGFAKTLELFTNPWTVGKPVEEKQSIMVEMFVYPNVLSQAEPRGMNIVPIAMDPTGILPYGVGALEDVLENWNPAYGQRPHLLYTVT
jgi:DNA-binding transcriptional MocR family regulator